MKSRLLKPIGFAALFSALFFNLELQAQIGPGDALGFNGSSSQEVRVPHAAALDAFPMTVELWVNTTNAAANTVRGLASKYLDAAGNGWSLHMVGGSLKAWYFRDISNYVFPTGSGLDGGFVADGQWHHVAFVVDASGGKIYVDGVLANSAPWSGSPGATTSTEPLHLGNYSSSVSTLNGTLDEVRLWNVARTQAQIESSRLRSVAGTETGLVGCWRFDESAGTVAHNASPAGAAYNGSLLNTPAHVASTAPIILTDVGSIIARPYIVSVAPTNWTGGSTVTIAGGGFAGTTNVQFNGIDAGSFAVQTNGQITATVRSSVLNGMVTVFTTNGTASHLETFATNKARVLIILDTSSFMLGSTNGASPRGDGSTNSLYTDNNMGMTNLYPGTVVAGTASGAASKMFAAKRGLAAFLYSDAQSVFAQIGLMRYAGSVCALTSPGCRSTTTYTNNGGNINYTGNSGTILTNTSVDGGVMLVNPATAAKGTVFSWIDNVEDFRDDGTGNPLNGEVRADGPAPLAGSLRSALNDWYLPVVNYSHANPGCTGAGNPLCDPTIDYNPYSVVLIAGGSDNVDNNGVTTPATVASQLRFANPNGGGVRTYVISLQSGSPSSDMNQTALAGGTASAYAAHSAADVESALVSILSAISPGEGFGVFQNPYGPLSYGSPLSSYINYILVTNVAGGTFAFTPGLGTILPAGTNIIGVTLNPNPISLGVNTYMANTNLVVIISPATPVLTWTNPAPLPTCQPLGATQLNATASVPGTFTYSPPLGTYLTAGSNQILSVTFTPADTNNYTSATATASLNVFANTLPPTLALLGSNPLVIPVNGTFTDPGATATDFCDGNLTGSVVASGAVNTAFPGLYLRTYAVTNSSGNFASINRSVFVTSTPLVSLPTAIISGTNISTGIRSGQLTGSVVPNGLNSIAYFEYGLTTSYPLGALPSTNLAAGYNPVGVSSALNNLLPGGIYHFHLVASNSMGMAASPDQIVSVPGLYAAGDLNGDGVVDQNELNSVLSNYWASARFVVMTNPAKLYGDLFQFGLTNTSAWNFTVQVSTNLVDWTNLPSPAHFVYQFNDPNGTNQPQRYYRLAWP